MRLAITGGAGFLGYHLCNRLFDRYEEIFVLDVLPIEPQEYPKNVKYFNADVKNLDRLRAILKDADLVIHAAAALPLCKRKEIFAVNVNGTKNVLEVAKHNKISRVIYVSSTAVYGVPKRHPIYEDDPLIGVGPYGETKIIAEKLCQKYREYGMCIPIVRPKTFIGTGRLGVFQILYDWVASGKRIPIIGNGRNRYQLLEVEDLIDALYLFLVSPREKVNDNFNVAAQEFKSVREDMEALCSYAGTGARVLPTPAWLVEVLLALLEKLKLSPLYKWIYGTAGKDSFVSIEKIKNTLGWLPKYSNAEALIRSYKWYIEHKDEFSETGLTHRMAWNQGALAVLKRFL